MVYWIRHVHGTHNEAQELAEAAFVAAWEAELERYLIVSLDKQLLDMIANLV